MTGESEADWLHVEIEDTVLTSAHLNREVRLSKNGVEGSEVGIILGWNALAGTVLVLWAGGSPAGYHESAEDLRWIL